MTTHREVKELLGVYALNALDSDERRQVESHLLRCEDCTQELTQHLETLAVLTEDEHDLPPALWDQIASSLEEPSPPRLAVPKAMRWSPSRLGMALAAAASIVFAVMGVRLIQQEQRLDTLTAAIEQQSIGDVAQNALADPDATLLSLQSPDRSTFARVVILPDGSGYLTSDNLSGLPADKTYQLWALRGEEKISLGLLGNDPAVSAFRSVSGAAGFAITIEQAGGVELTKANPIVFGFVEA